MLKTFFFLCKFRMSRQINNTSMIITILITNILTCCSTQQPLICKSGSIFWWTVLSGQGERLLFLSDPVLPTWCPKATRLVHGLFSEIATYLTRTNKTFQEVTQINAVCTACSRTTPEPACNMQKRFLMWLWSTSTDSRKKLDVLRPGTGP